MPSSDHISLTELPQELRRCFGVAIAYRTLWNMVVSGELPAEKSGSRWRVAKADLPAIAQILGAKLPVAA